MASTASLKGIEQIRQQQKEETRASKRLEMIETQKQIEEIHKNPHQQQQNTYSNKPMDGSINNAIKKRKPKKKITYKLNGEKFVIYYYYKQTKIISKGARVLVMYVFLSSIFSEVMIYDI